MRTLWCIIGSLAQEWQNGCQSTWCLSTFAFIFPICLCFWDGASLVLYNCALNREKHVREVDGDGISFNNRGWDIEVVLLMAFFVVGCGI